MLLTPYHHHAFQLELTDLNNPRTSGSSFRCSTLNIIARVAGNMTLSSNGLGTQAYFSSYLNRIREAHPDFPLDPVVFQSILLCLIAGGSHGERLDTASRGSKHLILRTTPEEVGLVLNITTLVSFLIIRRVECAYSLCYSTDPQSGRYVWSSLCCVAAGLRSCSSHNTAT